MFYQAGLISENKYRENRFSRQAITGKILRANSFYSLKYPNQFEATKTGFVSLKYESNTRIKLSSAIYLRRQLDRFELRRDTIPFNHHLTNNAGIKINAKSTSRFGDTNGGIEIRNEHIISTVLGVPLEMPVKITGYNNFYSNFFNRLSVSLYADHTISLNRFTVKAGLLAYHLSHINGFRVYPGIDLKYTVNDKIKLYSSINSSFRNPTYTDLFYKSPVQKAGHDLVAEEAFIIEGGDGLFG